MGQCMICNTCQHEHTSHHLDGKCDNQLLRGYTTYETKSITRFRRTASFLETGYLVNVWEPYTVEELDYYKPRYHPGIKCSCQGCKCWYCDCLHSVTEWWTSVKSFISSINWLRSEPIQIELQPIRESLLH